MNNVAAIKINVQVLIAVQINVARRIAGAVVILTNVHVDFGMYLLRRVCGVKLVATTHVKIALELIVLARLNEFMKFEMTKQQMNFLLYLFAMPMLVSCAARKSADSNTMLKNNTSLVTPTVIEIRPVPTEIPITTSTQTSQPTATQERRTLVICLDAEPDSLYPFSSGSELGQREVLDAIFDGPIDNRSFSSQPVILEKLPDLNNGDATLQSVQVQAGDQIIDMKGNVVTLKAGMRVYPSGCSHSECSSEYKGTGAIAMDQLVVTFRLLPDLKWSDGVSLTADDSVYAFHLAADPSTPIDADMKYKIERTSSYKALSEISTQWTGLPGYLDQTYFLNFWMPLPEHAWGKFTAEQLLEVEDSTIRPIGWGPYVIQTWKFGEYIQLRKNPYYFRAAEGLPRFDTLIYRFIPEGAENSIALLLSGKCDIISQEIDLTEQIEYLLQLKEDGKIKAEFANSSTWEYIAFAVQPAESWHGFSASGAFQDARLRRAIALCMDRQSVADRVFYGQTAVLSTYLPPGHPLYNPNIVQYTFDPQAGSSLLDDIGWVDHDGNPATPRVYRGNDAHIPQGLPLEFNYWTTAYLGRPMIAQILADSLAQCGIHVNVAIKSAQELFTSGPEGLLYSRRFDVIQSASLVNAGQPCEILLQEQIPGDPTLLDASGQPLYPAGWNGVNISGYSDPEYEQVCKAILSHLPGQPGYNEYYFKSQEILARDLPLIPLYSRLIVTATRPDMCNYVLDTTEGSDMWNIEAFDYGPNCR